MALSQLIWNMEVIGFLGGDFLTETGWRCLRRGNGFCKSKERNEREREKIENSEVVSHSVWLKSRISLERVNGRRGY